jgi:acetyl-CoA C-acetyltransferase
MFIRTTTPKRFASTIFSKNIPKLPNGIGRPKLPVYIVGSGIVPVTRKKGATLAEMGGAAIRFALADAKLDANVPRALYVGNMLSGMLSKQQHLGPLLANAAGLVGVEAATAEACCGAGGAALRWGYLAIASGAYETVVVAGVEQMTHVDTTTVTHGLATASHWETEGANGATFVSLNGIIMKEYMARYNVKHDVFYPFPATAHQNAHTANHATLRNITVNKESYEASRVVTPPIHVLDASPICDGSAAVVLTSDINLARSHSATSPIQIIGSAAACDDLPVAARPDPLVLRAVTRSTDNALAHAGRSRADIDIFELHDAYSIMACVSLESAGFVAPGEGHLFAADGEISLKGALPIATFGGLKARGHPVGATGVYQAAEMHRQLTNRAEANQVQNAKTVMIQNIGGSGASVFTAIITRDN